MNKTKRIINEQFDSRLSNMLAACIIENGMETCRNFTDEDIANAKGNGDKFDTYKEAYIELVNAVSGEMGDGYEPTLYTIREHSFTRYGETENTMIKPVWN